MSSADFNNLALRRTVSYQPDGSFVTSGYVFAVGQHGRQNWTNSLTLDGLTLSTLILNSPLQVSTLIAGQTLLSSLAVSTLGVSTMIGSTVYAATLGYGTLSGSTINASTLTTPNVIISTVQGSSIAANNLTALTGSFTGLQSAAAITSSMNAIAMITCTMAASTINFTVVNFGVSNVSTLTNNSLVNTSTIQGSTMTLLNLSTSALSVSTLQASTLTGATLSLTSSLQGSSITTGLLGFSTGTGSTLTLQTFTASTLTGSTVTTGTARITALSASTIAGSTVSTASLVVQSTATISTANVTTVNYTTLLGNSITANASQVRSTLTVSTVNTVNVSFTTLTGITTTANGAIVNSTLGVSTVNTLNTSFSTSLGSSLTLLGGAIKDLKTSTLAGSTLGMNVAVINSTLGTSSLSFTNGVGGGLLASDVACSTLETSTMILNTAVIQSTLGVSSMGVSSVTFGTLQGGTVTANLAVVSTITGSTINFQNLGFSSLLISTITVNTAFPSLLGASTMATQTLGISTLLSVAAGATVGIGTTTPVYPLTVAAGGLLGVEMNQKGAPLGSTMYGSGAVYSVTHPTTGFRGEYAYAYGGATVLASAAESQAVGYFAIDVAQAGVFGTLATGVPTAATFYVDNTKTTMVGALGVGTTAPLGMLAVAQDLGYGAMTLNPMAAQLVIGGKTNGGVIKIGAYATGGLFGAAMQSSYLVSGSDTVGTLSLNPLGGMVGIGISAPAFSLDVGLGSVQAGSLQITGQNVTPSYLRLSTAASINRVESGTLAISGSAAPLYLTNFGATSVWMSVGSTGLVGIGTTNAIAPLHVYSAAGVSLASTGVVNYTQTTALGFNYGGGSVGTRDSFQIGVSVVNRDGGAGPTYYDTGAQCDLVFRRKTNAYYTNNPSDKTYTEVMRLGGATGLVGIGTTAGAGILSVWGDASIVAAYWGSALSDTAVDWETTATGGRRWRMGVAATSSTVAGGGSLYWYDVTGAATRMTITSAGSVGMGTTAPTAALHVVGNVYVSGTVTQGSDARFKTAIRPLEGVLEKIGRLRGYTYERVDYVGREMGLLAQEVEAVFPELVEQHEDRLRLNYAGMVAPLIEAVRALMAEIQPLKDQIAALHARVERT